MTVLREGQWTPAPWINVIANPGFGFQVSEAGSGSTWAINSRENKLTSWSNDPVSDPPGEVIYVRDEETGDLWTPTPLPIREDSGSYQIRHGQGYSRFERVCHGVGLDLLQLVPLGDPVKISRLRIENRSARPRRLCVTGYVEWVLGVSRSDLWSSPADPGRPSSNALPFIVRLCRCSNLPRSARSPTPARVVRIRHVTSHAPTATTRRRPSSRSRRGASA